MSHTITGPEHEKIQSMFAGIASRYDLANTILSLGIHHVWRKQVVKLSGAQPGMKVLDCATGTGDLALEFKRVVGSGGEVIGTDFCPEMLETAPLKAKQNQLDVAFAVADVMNLPFDDGSFDISSISFGIRNVQDPLRGISELARVVKPGTGRVMVLEFGQMRVPVIRELYNVYSSHILPRIGGLITGKPEAYKYLQSSSARFPCGEQFVGLMNSTGMFSQVTATPIMFGLAYIYSGIRS